MARTTIILFTMPGCPGCAAFKPEFYQAKNRYARQLVYASVDVIELDATQPGNGALAERYGIDATPTILILRPPTGWVKIDPKPGAAEQAFQLALS